MELRQGLEHEVAAMDSRQEVVVWPRCVLAHQTWSSEAGGDRCTKIDDGEVEFSNGISGGVWWSCGARNRARSRLVVAACSRAALVKARWRGGEWMAAELGYAVMTDELGFAGERGERIRADRARSRATAGCGGHGGGLSLRPGLVEAGALGRTAVRRWRRGTTTGGRSLV